MKWLRRRGRGTARHSQEAPSDEIVRAAAADRAAKSREIAENRGEAPGPRVMLLVRDAVGPAAYRLHSFPDARVAEEYVSFWFRSRIGHGILAFWATHWRPALDAAEDDRSAEVIVLTRDELRPEIVSPFSLPDMGLAQSWVAREAAMGLDLSTVMVYWATPVKIADDHWGRVRLTPREPPRRGSEERAALSPPTLAPFLAAFEDDETSPEGDAHDAPEPVAGPGAPEPAAAMAAPEETPAEVETGAAAAPDPVIELQEPESVEKPEEQPAEIEAQAAPEPVVEPEAPEPAASAAARGRDRDENVSEVIDIAALMNEMKELLRAWRAEQQKEPFVGFGSPSWKF